MAIEFSARRVATAEGDLQRTVPLRVLLYPSLYSQNLDIVEVFLSLAMFLPSPSGTLCTASGAVGSEHIFREMEDFFRT